jgi:cystathionine beta-synthase
VKDLQTIDVKASVDELPPIFNQGHVAIVTEGETFHGLITRVDLLNYLRRRLDQN